MSQFQTATTFKKPIAGLLATAGLLQLATAGLLQLDETHRYAKQNNLAVAKPTPELFTELIEKDATEPIFYFNRGCTYQERRALKAAIADYTKAVDLNPDCLNAYNNRAAAYFDQDRHVQALIDCDELLRRASDKAPEEVREAVAQVLLNKGATLGVLNRSEEEFAVYDDLFRRFGTATDSPLRLVIAKALFNKGIRLFALNRDEEEIAVYDDLLGRFGTATEPPLHLVVAKALVNKGATLSALNRSEEAIGVYGDVLDRFGTATEPPLREPVAKALFNRGATFFRAALRTEPVPAGDVQKALADWREAIRLDSKLADAIFDIIVNELFGGIIKPNMPPPEELGDATLQKWLDRLETKFGREATKKEYARRASTGVSAHDQGMVASAHPPTQALARREARATTEHAWKPPSFPLPDALEWPVEQYDQSREYRKPDGILQHLERLWKSIIATESIDMPTLRAFYPSTAKAIDNFKHNNGKEPRCLPAELDIPVVQTGSGRRRKVGASPASPEP